MSPRHFSKNPTNHRLGDSIHFTNSLLSVDALFGNNFSNLFFSKFGARVIFPKRNSAFPSSVPHVVCVTPKKQVIWSYARRIIAMVTNKFAFRNISMCDHPRRSGSNYFFLELINKKGSISFVRFCSNPRPASVTFYDTLPESYFFRNSPKFMRTFLTATEGFIGNWTGIFNLEVLPTLGTFALLHKELTFLFEVSGHSHANAIDPSFLTALHNKNQLKSL